MTRIFSTNQWNPDLTALLLRLIFGGLFIYHGYMKIDHYHEYLAMSKPIIGLSGKLAYNLVMGAEFGCGILLVLGFLTRLSVLPIMFVMIIAYFVAHKGQIFQMKELAFVFLVLSFLVLIVGSGKYSLDHLLFNKKRATLPASSL